MSNYRHETVEMDHNIVGIAHFRLFKRSSGIISVTEIAQTGAMYNAANIWSSEHSRPLPISHAMMGRLICGAATTPYPKVIDSQDVSSLEDFRNNGIDQWKKLVLNRQITDPVRLWLNEKTTVKETISSAGLILPCEPPEVEFRGYVARPDEIEALESMVLHVNQGMHINTETNVGMYL